MPEELERIGLHLPSLIAYLVNFAVLLGLLYAFAYRPFLRLLRERAERIERGVAAAAFAEETKAQAMEQARQTVEAAKLEARALVAQSRGRGEEEAARIVLDARQAAKEHAGKARQAIEQERRKAFEEVARAGEDLVLAATARVLGRALDAGAHRDLVRAALAEVRAAGPLGRGPPPPFARVTAAVPLTLGEWEEVEEAVRWVAGGRVRVLRATEPAILGGLTVALGDVFIDASVLGRLEGMRRSFREA